MRKITLVLFFLTISILQLYATTPNADKDFLPIGLTEEEKTRLDEIGLNYLVTDTPAGIIRNPAEWEPSEGVLVRWPLGISVELVAEMSEDLMVTTIVADQSEENYAISYYSSGGVNMANTQFIRAATNSIWVRDYGPWFIFEDNSLAIVDQIYNRPRPQDDLIPGIIGDEWNLDVYGMDLITTGGNHMSDGLGMSMSTRLVYDENPGKTTAEVDSLMLAYLGNDYTVLNYIESGGIHHIDCWAKFLSPATIMVKRVPSGDPSYTLLNDRANYLAQQISAWGTQYRIIRIYCPSGTAYTNSIILNDKVLVPIFGSSYDSDALRTYEDAMPGYEVIGFYGDWYDNDAIHCRTMGVPDRGMLFIDHVPVQDSYLIGVHIHACSGAELIEDSLKVYYQAEAEPWQYVMLNSTADPDSFYANIPYQNTGTRIKYYIKAADQSGRIETHPYIGEPGAHNFAAPEIEDIPTLSEWGMIILALILLAGGTVAIIHKRKYAEVSCCK